MLSRAFLCLLIFATVVTHANAQTGKETTKTAQQQGSPAKNVHQLDVQQAVAIALDNVVQIQNAKIDLEIQASKNKEILGQALPQVSGTAGIQHYLQLPQILFPDASATAIYSILKNEGVLPNAKVPDPEMRSVSFQQPWNTSVGATLTQLLFQPDVFVGLQARKTAINYASSNIETAKQQVKDQVYRSYYAILIAEKQRDYLLESITRLEKLYSDQETLHKNGFVEKLALDQTLVQLTNLKTTANTVNNNIKLAYGSFKLSIGLPQADSVILTEKLTTETVKEGVLDDGFKYEDRPEIRTLQLARDLQRLDVKRHKMSFFPTVAAQANYTVNGMGQNFITDKNTTWIKSSFLGLSASIPIFTGFQRLERIKQAQLNLNKMDNTISNVKQQIDMQQLAAKESLRNALLNLDAQQRNIDLANKVYNSTKTKFENGMASNTDVLMAEESLQRAQSNYFDALYNAIVSKISYQTSIGKLQ